MCSITCLKFGKRNLSEIDVKDKEVIEVGAYNVNGSIRDHVLTLQPKKYLGVDMMAGSCVDVVCNAYDIVDKFGANSFDVVISTEMLEHIEDWRRVISNFKRVCRPGGVILITTRSKGFGRHSYPADYWRYEYEDMQEIFSDCIIEKLEKDTRRPGVFIKVKKPEGFVEKNLSKHQLFSMTNE